ncbi:MAG: hypothetical protein LEGION0398_MBIBDBAK_01445 [Legionellaceae bacterium]
MKKIITNTSKNIFNLTKNKALIGINQKSLVKDSHTYVDNYLSFDIYGALDEFIKRNQTAHFNSSKKEKNTVTQNISKNCIEIGFANNIKSYNNDLEETKCILDKGDFRKTREKMPCVILELEKHISTMESLEANDTLISAYKELLAKAYTYEGLSYSMIGTTKSEDIALTKFDKAIQLAPHYELPQEGKKSILISRGILPTGETLVFEDGFEIKSIEFFRN